MKKEYETDLDVINDQARLRRVSKNHYITANRVIRITVFIQLLLFYLTFVDFLNQYRWAGITAMLGAFLGSYFLILWIKYSQYLSLAKIMLYIFCPNFLILIALSFFIGTLKLDDYIDASWFKVLIPLFICQLVSLLFICFILPGILDESDSDESQEGQNRIAWLIILYYVSLILTEIIFFQFTDQRALVCFSPLYFAMGYHLLINLQELICAKRIGPHQNQEISIFLRLWDVVFIVILIQALISGSYLLEQEEKQIFLIQITFLPLLLTQLINIFIQCFRND